jgi:hypothetical protein
MAALPFDGAIAQKGGGQHGSVSSFFSKKSTGVKVLQFKVLILEREWYIIKVIKWRSVSFERRDS